MPIIRLRDLIGQSEAAAFLRGVVRGGRYANAYLFHGPAGVGKGTAALAFARALLCEQVAEDRSLDDACGECGACTKSELLQHPDLKFLFPVSGEERELDDVVPETLAAWRDDPFFVFTYERAASIRLSLTRSLLRELAFKPFEAARRVVVVRDADRMREDQYSAMLKTIEEPGASTVWVLTTSRPSRLPATICSRCQSVRFVPIGEGLISSFLEQRVGVASRAARLLAALANGSLGRALSLREADPIGLRNQSLALLEPAVKGDMAGLWRAIQGFNRFGRAGRETLRRLIEFQQLWLRDLLRVRYGAPRDTLVNRDREAELLRQAERIDATEIRRRLMVLEEILGAIEGNVTADLALFSGLARASDPEFEEATWPAHATARWNY